MYFVNRSEAGLRLASKLHKYKGKKCTVVALSDGAVVVAIPIANMLQSTVTLLLTEPIHAPGEPEAVGSINHDGGYSPSSHYSSGQHQAFHMEYHHVFEQQKLQKLRHMHRLIGDGQVIRKDLLRNHHVILVAEGLDSVSAIDAAVLFLKSINVTTLIVATPFATIEVVDRMHILSDDIACLNVVSNFLGVDHYYEQNDLPDHETVIRTVQDSLRNWREPSKPKVITKKPI